MTGNQRLSAYMSQMYPGLELKPPLFYQYPIGIRFELGVPYWSVEDPAYFTTAQIRAILLFQEMFQQEDELCVAVQSYESIKPDHRTWNRAEPVFPSFLKRRACVDTGP